MRLLTVLFACTTLLAQVPNQPPVKSADGLWLVAPKSEDSLLSLTRSFSQGLTIDSENNVWTMVTEYRAKEPDNRDVWLYRSKDGGKAWQRVTKFPGKWSANGAIAGEPGKQILHAGWAAHLDGKAYTSAVYQQYDAGQGVWLGEPEVLQKGSNDQDQYSVSDLALDADGLVTALVATHRRPKRPPWPSGWSSGFMIREPGKGDAAWAGPFPVHTNTHGFWANLQIRDGKAHTSYRSSPGGSIIGYRSFSLADQKYDQNKDVEISVQPKTGRHVANASSLVVGPFGNRTVLYSAAAPGQRGAANGQLLIAHAGDDDKWHTEVLCDDPKMKSGNVSHEHFALVQGPGAQAIALYSKVSEDFQVLYRRILENGKPMDKEREIARSDVGGAYYRIVAMRDARVRSGVWAVVAGVREGEALGIRAVLAPRPPKPRWH
tara:strand:+ start:31805 stop:33103 length:1299 start_codon:yes stop_codon:yes gene_type:complete